MQKTEMIKKQSQKYDGQEKHARIHLVDFRTFTIYATVRIGVIRAIAFTIAIEILIDSFNWAFIRDARTATVVPFAQSSPMLALFGSSPQVQQSV